MVVAGGGVGGGWGAATEWVGTSQDLDEEEEEETGGDAAVTQQVVPGTTPVRRTACVAKAEPARVSLISLP